LIVDAVKGEYYVFKDESNSIKYMTPDDFHYFYGSITTLLSDLFHLLMFIMCWVIIIIIDGCS
jgi:hypothetical protein